MTKLARLLILMSMLVLLLALNVGVAFAAHGGDGTGNAPCAPVGSNISDQGFDNIVDPDKGAKGGDAIVDHNPLCPLHEGGPCEP